MARILPAEFDAQYGVTISIFDSHASILQENNSNEFCEIRFFMNSRNLKEIKSELTVQTPVLMLDSILHSAWMAY